MKLSIYTHTHTHTHTHRCSTFSCGPDPHPHLCGSQLQCEVAETSWRARLCAHQLPSQCHQLEHQYTRARESKWPPSPPPSMPTAAVPPPPQVEVSGDVNRDRESLSYNDTDSEICQLHEFSIISLNDAGSSAPASITEPIPISEPPCTPHTHCVACDGRCAVCMYMYVACSCSVMRCAVRSFSACLRSQHWSHKLLPHCCPNAG